jgi:pimeloyl-ACP methyl ester carboxylesterase
MSKGHVILSHGLNSSPAATKVTAMAAMAESLGWTTERPDFSDLDASGDILKLHERLERLLQRARAVDGPLVLAGSSMGAFISALASLQVDCIGLHLLVPPPRLQGFPLELEAAKVPIEIIHAWNDELIPAADVIAWAQARHARLILVPDGHRLEQHVDYCARALGRFLEAL